MSKKINVDVFENYSVPKAVFTLGIPSVLGMIVNIIYNMADTFFVGKTGDPYQVASVTLTMPLFFLFLAFGNIFGVGGGTFISRSMGEGQVERVKSISSSCFYMAIASGIVLTLLFFIFMNPILSLLGTSGDTELFTREYLAFIAAGGVFSVTSVTLSNLVRAEGAAKAAMLGLIIGSVVNIILDPIMILHMSMGVKGAAIATVIGNICSVAYYLLYFRRKNTGLSISPKFFTLKEIWPHILKIGLPASLHNLLVCFANILTNNILENYGDYQVAAMGLALRANSFAVMVQMGFSMGIQPLVGYNYGARNFPRLKKSLVFTVICTTAFGLAFTIFAFMYSEQIVRFFIDDANVIIYGIDMIRALMISTPLLGVLFTFTFAIQAMGRAIPSLILSVVRQGLLFVPILLIADRYFGFAGVILAQPITELSSTIIAVIITALIIHSVNKKEIANRNLQP